jgi:glycine/D-amino acid oxidase-like deaminating enzyme
VGAVQGPLDSSLTGGTKKDFDVVVIGGGIGGVCTAICLVESGRQVLLIEKDLLGSGASGSTVFQVHSGAKYSLDRPELARELSLAAPLWRELPVEGLTDTGDQQQETWLMTSRGNVSSKLQYALRLLGIPCSPVPTEELSTVLRQDRADRQFATRIPEIAVSPRRTMQLLAQRCLDLSPLLTVGVEEQAQQLIQQEGRVVGVTTDRRTVSASTVVLASGSGVVPLLQGVDPGEDRVVVLRTVSVIVANRGLEVALHSIDVGGPLAIPDGPSVSVSVVGASQPPSRPDKPLTPDKQLAALKLEQAAEWFQPSIIDTGTSGFIAAEKPEFHAADARPVPGTRYARDSSMTVRRIATGLVLVMPGKYSFGPVAGQAACRLITGAQTIPNPLRGGKRVSRAAVDLVHPMPWLQPRVMSGRPASSLGMR